MTDDIIAAWITGIIVLGSAGAALYENCPHWFRHDWEKWQDVPATEPGLADLYFVQERVCKTCGVKEQRSVRKAVL